VISLKDHILQCDHGTIWEGRCNRVTLSVPNPQVNMTDYWDLGNLGIGKVGGSLYQVNIRLSSLALEAQPGATEAPPDALVKYVNISSVRQTIETKKDFSKGNTWVNWLVYTAKNIQCPNCHVCYSRTQISDSVICIDRYPKCTPLAFTHYRSNNTCLHSSQGSTIARPLPMSPQEKLGGDPGEDPGHAGGITSPSWPVNTSGSPRMS